MQYRITLALAAVALAACAQGDVTAPDLAPSFHRGDDRNPGAVYTLTNQTSGNAVAIFHRATDGSLAYAGAAPTGGLGTGAGLSSQGAVTLSDDGRHLIAVNAGSDDITLFAVTHEGLTLVERIASGGVRPVSVAIRHHLVYVLNAGGSGNISAFTLAKDGLSPIAGSSRPLSSSNAGAAQVSFAPDGKSLVVTERFTNAIDVYSLGADGLASQPHAYASSGPTPFGFDFTTNGALIVSEAFGGAPDASAASSYAVDRDGQLSVVTGSLGTTETAACWLVVSKDGKYAYTANAGSSSITGYAVGQGGALTLLDADGVTASTGAGAGALDLAVSGNGRFLYVLANRAGSVIGFRVRADGGLERVSVGAGLPAGTVGLAAR
jgi:6-phosphogluconolactonase